MSFSGFSRAQDGKKSRFQRHNKGTGRLWLKKTHEMDGQALHGSFRSHSSNCSNCSSVFDMIPNSQVWHGTKRDAPSFKARILDSSKESQDAEVSQQDHLSLKQKKAGKAPALDILGAHRFCSRQRFLRPMIHQLQCNDSRGIQLRLSAGISEHHDQLYDAHNENEEGEIPPPHLGQDDLYQWPILLLLENGHEKKHPGFLQDAYVLGQDAHFLNKSLWVPVLESVKTRISSSR